MGTLKANTNPGHLRKSAPRPRKPMAFKKERWQKTIDHGESAYIDSYISADSQKHANEAIFLPPKLGQPSSVSPHNPLVFGRKKPWVFREMGSLKEGPTDNQQIRALPFTFKQPLKWVVYPWFPFQTTPERVFLPEALQLSASTITKRSTTAGDVARRGSSACEARSMPQGCFDTLLNPISTLPVGPFANHWLTPL